MAARVRSTPITRIGLDELKIRNDQPVFVDARSATALHRNPLQVPGAIHLPVKALDTARIRLPHDRTIITYCT